MRHVGDADQIGAAREKTVGCKEADIRDVAHSVTRYAGDAGLPGGLDPAIVVKVDRSLGRPGVGVCRSPGAGRSCVHPVVSPVMAL